MQQITFGTSHRLSVYALGDTTRMNVERALRVRGHANVSVTDVADDAAWEGESRLRLVSGAYNGVDPHTALYLVADDQTEAAVAEALHLLKPDAVLNSQWITRPE